MGTSMLFFDSRPRFPFLLAALVAALLQGCASYDGRSLVPGQSVSADVEQLMGPPAEKIGGPAGETVWFYPRNPAGRHTYAVRIGPDGVVRAIEQRLTVENIGKLVAGQTTAKDVRALFGPPNRVTHLSRQQRDVWEYRMLNQIDVDYNLFVQFSFDGIVREALFLRDPRYDQGPGGYN
jgi:hypothetical protein